MKKLLLLALIVALSFSVASAQRVQLIFGNSDGNGSVDDIVATNGAPITVPLWINTEPGTDIVGVTFALASNNVYIATRNNPTNGNLFHPFENWDDITFRAVGNDAVLPNHLVQAILGVKDLTHDPHPEDGIQTEGAWWHIADYLMTTTTGNDFVQFCDAFAPGADPNAGPTVMADYYTGGIPDGDVVMMFSCLTFTDNTDPVWDNPPSELCGDAGQEVCFDLRGTDLDVTNDLHIVQTAGPGTYTETLGGEGGVTEGTWCGTLAADVYTLEFSLEDNAGGSIPLTVTVSVDDISLTIGEQSGYPGTMVTVPVTLSTCEFMMGGMQIYIGWDPTALALMGVRPTGRIDDGNEYWYVNSSDPCQECPDDDAVRITWISDINNGVHHSPAYAGNEPIFLMDFMVSEDLGGLWGMVLPVTFLVPQYTDNSISDSTGYTWFRPVLNDGSVTIVDPSSYKGDPNMNGTPYEVGDAVLVARRLIEGYGVWAQNGMGDDAIQESAADLNNNGVPDVADLVRFINIINHTVNPPKLEPVSGGADITVSSVIGDNIDININSGLEIGGVLLSIDHSGVEIGTPIANGMNFLANDHDGVLDIVVYSLEANTIAAGNSNVITIPVVSNNNGSVEILKASSSDAYGRLLETTSSVVVPLPTEYAVSQNYPNPFNAKTLISFDLPNSGNVTVNIYSVTGQLVESISNEFEAGHQSVTWDASNVASGVYFYKVSAGDFSQTMKMTLLK